MEQNSSNSQFFSISNKRKLENLENKVDAVLDRWLNLQKIIKEEITLNEIITKQQQTSIENLKSNYYDFYRIKLKIRETFENVINIDTGNYNLSYFELNDNSEKMLLEIFDPIKKLLFLFRNDFQIMLKLILIIDQYASKDNINTLVDLICHQFYENLLIQNPEHEELLILCYLLLEKEIENMNSASVSSFLDESNTFIGKLLKSYTKKQELKTYLTVTLGSLIMKIENSSEGCLDLDLSRLSNYVNNKINTKVVNKSYNEEKTKSIMGIDNENLTKQIHKSKLIRNSMRDSKDHLTESKINFSFREGITVNNEKFRNSVMPGTLSSELSGLSINREELKKNLNNLNSSNSQCQRKSPKSTNSSISSSKLSTSNNQNDFFLELVDCVDRLKYEDNDEFNTEYMIEMSQDELNTRLMEEPDENMREFYIKQLERINRNPDIFTNKNFLINLKDYPNNEKILVKYKENFQIIKDFVDSIIKSLLDNTSTIPYTLRCICKIIKVLIDRKFPDISKYEKNALIGEFIFGKCILPILINSDINAVITSSILSANTKKCLSIIAKVLTRINRGIFFDGNSETYFTIFNHYIIEIMPAMDIFYDNLVDVPLPKLLEELISVKSKSDNSYKKIENQSSDQNKSSLSNFSKYNYFQENVEELVNIQCICFSIQDILLIVKYLKPKLSLFKNNSQFQFSNSNLLVKSIEKISNQENYLNQVIKLNPKRNFFLIFNIENNPNKMDLLYPKIFRFTFTNEIESNEIILKRIKFCIKLILRGINMINHRVYSHLTSATTTQNFFIALNQILQLEEYTETEFNDKIPLNWYSLYMTTNLQYLSEDYKKNDYEKLFCELFKEGKDDIYFLNNKSNLVIAKYGLNTRCVEKIIEKIKRDLIKVKQIEKFMKMEKYIRKAEINVCVRTGNKEEENPNNSSYGFFNFFGWNKRKTLSDSTVSTNNSFIEDSNGDNCTITVKSTEKCLHKRLQYLEKLTEGKPEKKSSKGKYKNEDKIDCHASNISEFITLFGRYNEIKEDIIKGDQAHKIFQSIFNYILIVKERMVADELFVKLTDDEKDEILEGIENFIMKKLYKKVYPKEAFDKDKEFFERTCQLSWLTPADLDIDKAYLNENLMILAINCVNKMDEEKTPFDKLKCIASAHKIINNAIKFCSGKDENAGADDLSPIFQYIILKAKPKRLFSNINFIKCLMHPKKLQGFLGLLLAQIESAAEFILKELDYEKLKISKEEFLRKMENEKYPKNYLVNSK